MKELSFVLLMLFVSQAYSQSRVVEYRKMMTDSDAWGEGDVFVDQLYHLSHLAIEEDSFDLYEQCLSYIRITKYDLKDFIGFDSALQVSYQFALDTLNSSITFRSALLNDQAILSRSLGNYQEANNLYLEAISLESDKADSEEQLIRYYLNIINNLKDLGDAKKSKEYLDYLLSADIEYEPEIKVKLYIRNSEYYYSQEDYRGAIENLKMSLLVSEEIADQGAASFVKARINIYHKLADSYVLLAQLGESKKWINKALKLQEDLSYRLYRSSELNGKYYLARGELRKAGDFFDLACQDALSKFSQRSEFQIIPRMYLNLARYYEKVDSIDMALNAVQEGLRYSTDQELTSIDSNPMKYEVKSVSIAFYLLELKSLLATKKYLYSKSKFNYSVAKSSYKATLNLLSQMRESYILEGSKFYTIENAVPVFDEFINLIYDNYLDTGNFIELGLIDSLIQNTKSAVLNDKLDYKSMMNNREIPDLISKKEKEVRKRISLVTKSLESLSSDDDKMQSELKNDLFKLNQEYSLIDNEIQRMHPKYYQLLRGVDEYYKSDLAIEDGELVIEYYSNNSFLYSVFQDSEGVKVYRDSLRFLKENIYNFQKEVSTNPTLIDQNFDLESVSSSLANSLLHLDKYNFKNVKKLKIIPNGILSSIPFEALIFEGKYLIESMPISYYYSKAQLFSLEKSIANNKVLAMAPSYSELPKAHKTCNNLTLDELQFSQDEISSISDNYKGEYFYGLEATKSEFISQVNNHSIIHLATHVCLNEDNSMLSEIHFSDGVLTNYDLRNLDINPSLVVLAACNSARGEIQKGEGILSMSRGFFEAGVESLISSLWSIDDYSSSQIVKGVYSNLNDGKSKSEALQLAKLEHLSSSDKLRSHPYYWAGLIQIGNNSPLIVTGMSSLAWLIAVICFLIILLYRYYKLR